MTNCDIIPCSKTIAVTSLGLYAGLMTSSTLIASVTPLSILSDSLKSVLCKLGCWATVLGSVATGAFATSYILSEKAQRTPTQLAGALVVPITGLSLWISSLVNHGHAKVHHKSAGSDDLPKGHPKVGADAPACPFSKKDEGSSVNLHCSSVKSNKCYNAMLCHLSVVTFATCGIFAKSVFDGFHSRI
ncbi:Protein SCM4 [Nakaseomyces bracarensis]|uniref:Protein SCM4 n=1 Tax=Nakaseomyces bracarensis TaxID=273131 RepID=A0ABR4NNG5_9SACH